MGFVMGHVQIPLGINTGMKGCNTRQVGHFICRHSTLWMPMLNLILAQYWSLSPLMQVRITMIWTFIFVGNSKMNLSNMVTFRTLILRGFWFTWYMSHMSQMVNSTKVFLLLLENSQ